MKYTFLLTAFFIAYSVSAQTVFFNNISQQEGLRNGNVRAVVKDYQGFIWIGTEDGLHRFDGYTMKIYSNAEGDPSTIGSNFILCLFEDSYKNLWVGTLDGGLYVYTRKTDSFKHIKLQIGSSLNSRVPIRSLLEGKDRYMYVGTDKLFRSKVDHQDSMRFSRVPFITDSVTQSLTRFAAIAHDLDSNLLISVNNEGLFSYNLSSGKSYAHPISLLENNISTIYADRLRNIIWIGSWNSGLFIYDPLHSRHLQIKAGSDDKSLRNNFIPSLAGDPSGNIWIASDNGLSRISNKINPFEDLHIETYLPGKSDNTRIHGNIMKTVYVDNEDKVWAGTIYEGVNIYDKNSMNFGSLSISTDVNSPLSYGNINAIQESKDGSLWLGLDGGGLYRFEGDFNNTESNILQYINVPENIDKIKTLKIDNDSLWIGTWGSGLFVFNLVSGKCKRINPSASGINIGTEIMSLNKDRIGNLWIGSFDKGLFRYHPGNGQVTTLTARNQDANLIDRINAIHVDKENNVWIGRDVGGLNFLKKNEVVYDPVTTKHLNPSTTILCIFQDDTGIVWIGAQNAGLIRYDPASNTSELYNEKHGLTNRAIHSILEDNHNRLWISHNAGISLFDKKGLFFRNFGKRNGITESQFNNNSSVERTNGKMVFGHIHGANSFFPTDFTENRVSAPIVFTRFFLNNVEQAAGSGVLSENITTLRDITLQHDQNSFSIEFAAMNFEYSDEARYAYMLEGFESDWQVAGSRRLISYTNLEPGEYLLKVKSNTNLNSQSSSTNQLLIRIIPAWWQTLWFKILLATVVVLTAVIVPRLRIRFLLRQKAVLEEKVDLRTKKLNDTNQQLQDTIAEIHSMNLMLQNHQREIFEKNSEIQAQNEELQSQNEQIVQQQDSLLNAREQLKETNSNLEKTVAERTEELKRTINDLNKTVFELDRFVYSASHDLSAPLKSIHGLVEIIKLEPDHSKILEYTAYVKTTVQKLEEVIKSMIDYARNTHTLVKVDCVNLKSLIEEVTLELAFWQEATKIRFVNSVDDGLEVQTDKARLKVILHNLINNSIKYQDPGKDVNWIKFECSADTNSWQLSITDNGIGIRHEYLDKIFNMYFRATDTSKGSGLGLFIVKETLRKINGSIRVESELGNFTRFFLIVEES